MINIIGKINKDNYREFTNSDFFGYEVFLASEEDFHYLPDMISKLNIVSVHQPSRNFNLCNEGQQGEGSFRLLERLLSILDNNNFKGVLVVHGAYFDELSSQRDKHLEIMAKRIDILSENFANIKISLENDVWFLNQIKKRRALLAEPKDFFDLREKMTSHLYITLDFEHMWISSIFSSFFKENESFCVQVNDTSDLNKPEVILAKKTWFTFIENNKNNLEKLVSKNIKEYHELQSSIVNFHLNGSNMFNYWFDEKIFIPYLGEHLCIQEEDDNINYNLIRENLDKLTKQKDINIVLEIWPREKSRYVVELKKSGNLAREIFKNIK
ncbi:MAG: hypothetical protein WCV69_02430 [Patescibacteria group bacterium]|jgi:hypothetical protein